MQQTIQQEAMRQERRHQRSTEEWAQARAEGQDAAMVRQELAQIRNDVLADLRREDV